MKVLHVMPSYEPAWSFGGTVKGATYLCRGLVRQGVDVTFYTTDADGKGGHLDVPLNEPVDLGGVKVWYFRCDFGIKKAFYSKALSQKLKETVNDFDLVHVSAIWQWIQIEVSRICRSAAKPYIVSTHGSLMNWGLRKKRWKRLPYWYLFSRPTVEGATAIHYVTEGERGESTRNFRSKVPSFVIPSSVDCKKFIVKPEETKTFRERYGIPEDAFVISFLALIRPRKGLHLLVEALSNVKAPNLLLLIAGPSGDDSYCESLRQYIKNQNLTSKIKWIGYLQLEELAAFYGVSDLFVLPSFEEAFGMVIVEALAYETPVLISRMVPVWQEVVRDKAGEVIELDAQQIGMSIQRLLSNKNVVEQYAGNAKRCAESRYDIDAVAAAMKKAYENILTGKRSPELRWK